MSTCISRHGEFSSHELDPDFVCKLCSVLDEDAMVAELNALRAKVDRVRDVEWEFNRRAGISRGHAAKARWLSYANFITRALSGEQG